MAVKEKYKKHLLLESALEAIYDIGCPVYSNELAQYMRARWTDFRPSLSATRIERFLISHMSKCEMGKSFMPQPSLCPALTATHGEPIMRLIARTDWPLEWRIMAHTTGYLRHLRVTARLCELALNDERSFTNLPLLVKFIAKLARGIPGADVKHERYELKVWRDLAYGLINMLSDEDEQERIIAAMKLLTVQNFDLFYGTPEYLEEVHA